MSRRAECEFLSPAELKALAGGAATVDEQLRILTEEGLPVRRVGRALVVSRYHAREWLAGRIPGRRHEPQPLEEQGTRAQI